MPWAAAAAVVGAGISAGSANSAAKKQQGSAAAANQLAADQFSDTKSRNDPFYYGGTEALSILRQRLPELTAAYDPSKLTSEPGYLFGQQQGQKSLEASLASRGLGVSGAALKAAAQYGNDYSTTKLGEAFQRQQASNQQTYNQLMGLVQQGQASANQTAAAGSQYASTAGNNLIGAGNAGAAATLAGGNAAVGAINQGVSLYRNRTPGTSAAAPAWSSAGGGSGMYQDATTGTPAGYTDGTSLLGWADGGAVPELPPVRREPKIGTKAPPRKGGGGAMSREAILAAIEAGDPAVAPGAGRSGVGALPANPVTNPGAILRDREQKAGIGYADGGAVRSSTGGKADKVQIPVSGGEHVFDAEIVSMLGDGNTEAGHRALEELKQAIRVSKRGAPANRPAAALGMH